MALISLNKDNGKYASLAVTYPDDYYDGESQKIFDSGDFIKDWYDSIKFLLVDMGLTGRIYLSELLSDFIEKSPYDKAYLIVDKKTGESKLVYNKIENDDILDFFVPAGEKPTWNQLREYCGEEDIEEENGEFENRKKTKTKKKEEKKIEYKDMSQSEIRNLIDTALDVKDFDRVKELSKYLIKENIIIKKFNEFK